MKGSLTTQRRASGRSRRGKTTGESGAPLGRGHRLSWAALTLVAVLVWPATGGAADTAAPKSVPHCRLCDARQNVTKAVPWLKLGADVRFRLYYNNIQLDKHNASHEQLFHRHRVRLWATVTPVENLDVNIRLMGEPRF